MNVDGKKVAEEVLSSIGDALRGKMLGVVAVEGDAATESFLKIKSRAAERMGVIMKRFSPDQAKLAFACDGVVIQLPIPGAEALIEALPEDKDVDGLKNARVHPPVARAVARILSLAGVEVSGKRAVVVGAGKLVGQPVVALLKDLGASAIVITEGESLERLKDADIVVLGAGSPGLVKPEYIKEGVVLIDAGTSEASGKLAGDADPACAEKCSVFTPVPGGVGPIAVAMIFKNLLALVRSIKNSP